jgi:hypothetical protein
VDIIDEEKSEREEKKEQRKRDENCDKTGFILFLSNNIKEDEREKAKRKAIL